MADQEEFSKPYTFGQSPTPSADEFKIPYGTSPRSSRPQPQNASPSILTPAMEQEARVQGMAPIAQQNLQQLQQQRDERRATNPFAHGRPASVQSLSWHDIPVAGPMIEKGIAAVASKYPEANIMTGSDVGDTEEERYRNALAYQESRRRAEQSADPTAYTATRIGASIPTFALAPELGIGRAMTYAGEKTLGKVAEQMPSWVEKALGLVAKPIPAAVEGGIYTGAHTAASSAPGSSISDIGESAKTGFEEGAGAGYLLGLPVSGALSLGKYGANVTRSIWDPEGYAASEAAKAYERASPKEKVAGLSPEKAAEMSSEGKDVLPMDIAGGKNIGREAAANVPPTDPALSNINAQVVDRYNNRSVDVQNDVYAASGRKTNPNTGQYYTDFEMRELAENEARKVNSPAYKAAYGSPNAQAIWNDDLARVVNTNAGAQAVEKTIQSEKLKAAQEGRPFVNPFYRDQNGQLQINQNIGIPNLEFWDRFKRHMNDTADSLKRSGYKTEAEELNTLLYGDKSAQAPTAGLVPYGQNAPQAKFALVPFLKNLVPEYETALRGAQKYIKEDNAFDAGKNFLDIADVSRKSKNILEADNKLKDFSKYSKGEQDIFRQGLLANITENPAQAARIFGGGDEKTLERYRKVLGDDLFRNVDNTLRMHRISSVAEVLSGAPPQDRLSLKGVVLGTLGGGMGGTGIMMYGKDILNQAMQNPLITGAAIGTTAAVGAAYAAKRAIDKAMIGRKTEAILQMLGSGDQKTFERILQASKTDKQIDLALRNIEYGISRVAALQSQNKQPAPQQADGGRIGRDTGGRTNGSATSKAARLIARVDHIRKGHGKDTSALLNLDDDTVAKALSIANQKI